MWSLRAFLNTDTPALAKLWGLHHASIHSLAACPVHIWDTCVLSKPYFKAEELVLAIDELHNPVGFIHFGFVGNRDLQSQSKDHAAVHRICIAPCPGEDAIASQLLLHAEHELRSDGAKTCSALGGGDRSGFYLGIADGDNLMGLFANDFKTQRWLTEAGFAPVRPTECWELDLSVFRPPMDRMQIQARRTCTIGRMLDEDYDHWWTSTVLGHCEQTRFHLMIKSPPSLAGVVSCWHPDPSIVGLDSSVVRMVLSDLPETDEAQEQYTYLLAESLRQLQQERKRLVRVVASANQQRIVSLLHRLGFRSVEHGLLFEKAYEAGVSAFG